MQENHKTNQGKNTASSSNTVELSNSTQKNAHNNKVREEKRLTCAKSLLMNGDGRQTCDEAGSAADKETVGEREGLRSVFGFAIYMTVVHR